MQRAYDALGIPCPTTGVGAAPAGLISNAGQARPGLRLPLGNGGPNIPNLVAANMGGVRALAPPQGQPAPNVSLPLRSDSAPSATPGGATQRLLLYSRYSKVCLMPSYLG